MPYQYNYNAEHMAQMIAIQNKTQDDLLGQDWKFQYGAKAKELDFVTAMSVEAGEFAEHMAFKWWKNGSVDLQQAKMELVDIMHFMISHFITLAFSSSVDELAHAQKTCVSDPDCLNNFSKQQLAYIESLALAEVQSVFNIAAKECFLHNHDQIGIEAFNSLDSVKERTRVVNTHLRRAISQIEIYNMNDKRQSDSDYKMTDAMQESAKIFFSVMAILGMTFQEMYLLYVGKNTLNKFRWDNGYKEGTYVKVWRGKEDNEVLHAYLNILMKVDNLSPNTDYAESITKHLEAQYKTVPRATA